MEDDFSQDARAAKPGSALDRPLARWIALGVALAAAAALAAIHRDDLFPSEDLVSPAADDPVALCLRQRQADIAKMQADGVIDSGQAKLFLGRAEALCQAQAPSPLGGGGPGLPAR